MKNKKAKKPIFLEKSSNPLKYRQRSPTIDFSRQAVCLVAPPLQKIALSLLGHKKGYPGKRR